VGLALYDVTGFLDWRCYNPRDMMALGQPFHTCEVALTYTMRPDRLAHRVNLEDQESCLIPFGALGLSVEKTRIGEQMASQCRKRSEVVLGPELNAKRLELLHNMVPQARRVGFLFDLN
jgi:hypothetical protein